jgi:hypothetical protein
LRVGVFSGGGRQISRVPATRRSAGWRSSSPSQSGGAGTKGNGAVRGRSRRLSFPGSVFGRVQRGRGWSWPRQPVRVGGPGVRQLVGRVHRGLLDSVAWPCRVAWYRQVLSSAGAGCRGWFHHRRRPGGVTTRDSPHENPHESAGPSGSRGDDGRQPRIGWWDQADQAGSRGPGTSEPASFPPWFCLAGAGGVAGVTGVTGSA